RRACRSRRSTRSARTRCSPRCGSLGSCKAAMAACQLVLLDLDGVLVDSRDAMEEAWRAVQHDLGITTPFAAYFREIGRPFREILARLGLTERTDEIERVYFA